MNEEKSNDDGVKQEIKARRDDRYSSWNDGRYQSKWMKGWWFNFWFDVKDDLWPLFKKFWGWHFGPWPLQLFIAICVCFYLAQKFLL